jgi:hypothetical protein
MVGGEEHHCQIRSRDSRARQRPAGCFLHRLRRRLCLALTDSRANHELTIENCGSTGQAKTVDVHLKNAQLETNISGKPILLFPLENCL